MYDFIVALMWASAGFFVLLMLLILVNKAWREVAERRLRKRRVQLEPIFFRYVTGQGPIEEHLQQPLRPSDRVLVEEIFFDLGRVVQGSAWERAREAFERLGFVDHYIARLDSRGWWYRAEAAEKLGYIGSERGTQPLVRHMDDPVGEVRVRVARALGRIGTPEALDHLVEALRDPGRWSAIRVGGILINASEGGVERLMKAYMSLPFHARIAAIDIFARIRSLKASPLLLELLGDENPDIRARAAFALGAAGDPNSAEPLIAALKDKAWAVRAMAAKALGRLKEEGSIPTLCECLRDAEWWVRANAAEALKNKREKGRQALLGMLDSEDAYAAQQAVQMLQESGSLDGMIAQLGSPDAQERQAALEFMAKLVMLKRTDLLTEMAHNHPEASIRERLSIVLGMRRPSASVA